MSELSMSEFINDTKKKAGSTEHFEWKEKGKAVVWLHPKSSIFKRNVHWLPYYGEFEVDGKKKMVVTQLLNVCPGTDSCPACQLRKSLRDDKDIDSDEIILKLGKGKEYAEYNKGEIIGEEGYGWQKNLGWKTEYGIGVIDNDNPKQVQPYFAPKSLGKKITKVIEDQIDEDGDEKGNPFVNPYAIKFTYDEDAMPNDKYGATWNKAEMTDEIEELIDGPGVDIKGLCTPSSVERIAYLVREAMAYEDYELVDLSAADDFDPDDLKRGSDSGKDKDEDEKSKKSTGKNKGKPSKPTDDEEEEEKPKKSAGKAKTSKQADDEDDEKPKKSANKGKPSKPADDEEEEEKPKKPVGKTKTSKPADDDEEEEKPKKPAGKVKEKPKTKKKPQIECPNCEEMIDEDAKECPHCEAEFEDEEMIDCPECGEEIAASSETCEHCGKDVSPF